MDLENKGKKETKSELLNEVPLKEETKEETQKEEKKKDSMKGNPGFKRPDDTPKEPVEDEWQVVKKKGKAKKPK